MSWDADLIDDRGHDEGSWNYTHNCNGMANFVMADLFGDQVEAWWKKLHNMEGPAGAELLDGIVKGLEAEPGRFRAMNPENGWGDYDSFVRILKEMRDAIPEWPTKWSVNG